MAASKDDPVQIALLGASGRMGQWVKKLIETEFEGHAVVSVEASEGDPLEPLVVSDAVIDFSSPEAMAMLAKGTLRISGGILPAFVIGSTGWTPEQLWHVEALSKKARVLMASNFSTGVGSLVATLKETAPMMRKLGYTPRIVDVHHTQKRDAPSGTALTLAQAVSPTNPTLVRIESIRQGEVIGDHDVIFEGPGDTLTFRHHAKDRSIFARGAVEVALWLAARDPRNIPGKILGMDAYFADLLAHKEAP